MTKQRNPGGHPQGGRPPDHRPADRRARVACRTPAQHGRTGQGGHPARFETRTKDNHHHLACRTCGRTEDVDCVHGSAPCLEPSAASGFRIDEAVVFWGLCSDGAALVTAENPNHHSHHHHEEAPA